MKQSLEKSFTLYSAKKNFECSQQRVHGLSLMYLIRVPRDGVDEVPRQVVSRHFGALPVDNVEV